MMKTDENETLESIRRSLWLILAVLLMMFGYDHVPIGKTELGAILPILALAVGIGSILLFIGKMVFRFLKTLKEMADGEGKP